MLYEANDTNNILQRTFTPHILTPQSCLGTQSQLTLSTRQDLEQYSYQSCIKYSRQNFLIVISRICFTCFSYEDCSRSWTLNCDWVPMAGSFEEWEGRVSWSILLMSLVSRNNNFNFNYCFWEVKWTWNVIFRGQEWAWSFSLFLPSLCLFVSCSWKQPLPPNPMNVACHLRAVHLESINQENV